MENQYVELYNMNSDDEMKGVLQLNKRKKNKKGKKNIKKSIKELKKENKQLKKIIQFYNYQDMQKQNTVEKPKISFLEKLSDAIVKAIPTVLTTIINTILTCVYKGKSGSRIPHRNWAVGYN